MNFSFSFDNYYLMGAIAVAVLLVVVGAFMYIRNRGAPAEDETNASTVYEEAVQNEMPPPEGADEEEHAHAE